MKNYIDDGVDLNTANSHGHQVLMLAAHQGHGDIVKFLIEAGADLNAIHPVSGNTALIGAAFQGHDDVIKILIEAKADINQKNNNNDSALTMAIRQGHGEIINLLKTAGAEE